MDFDFKARYNHQRLTNFNKRKSKQQTLRIASTSVKEESVPDRYPMKSRVRPAEISLNNTINFELSIVSDFCQNCSAHLDEFSGSCSNCLEIEEWYKSPENREYGAYLRSISW